jgi:hypothetical protein
MNKLDISKFQFRDNFERADHTKLCAVSIEGIRTHLGARWSALFRPTAERDPQLREARKLVKHLVRVASESTDFYCTVDFITRSAAITVEKARKKNNWKALAGHLQPSSELTHEHMVPGEVVMAALSEAPPDRPLFEVLEPLTYRALVCKKKDIHRLDKEMRSTLPKIEQTRLAKRARESVPVPPAFKALVRYDAAHLLEDLIPVSPRAAQLKTEYEAWLA